MSDTSPIALGTAYETGTRPAQPASLGRIEGGVEPLMRGVDIVNPWGRAMPKSPPPRFKKPTHQLWVTHRHTGEMMAISPVMTMDHCLQALEGAKRGSALARPFWQAWGNPQILPISGLPDMPTTDLMR